MAPEIAIRQAVIAKFPALRQFPFELTSRATYVYNCIAWAIGDNQNFVWPTATWPDGVSRKVTRQSFIKLFARHGYKTCISPEPEDGFEKIALYEDDKGVPTHAARLLPNGRWSSKLGSNVDISHHLEGLIGEEYGAPAMYMSRPSAAFAKP